jgi:uncharacterized protein (DUF302 family)
MGIERAPVGDAPDGRGDGVTNAVVTRLSPWSTDDTLARLLAVIAARGMEAFAVIDLGRTIRDDGAGPRRATLVIFGHLRDATRVVDAVPLAALDLPFRVVVWEDEYQARLSYPAPAAVARRLGLDGELADIVAAIDSVTRVAIDR